MVGTDRLIRNLIRVGKVNSRKINEGTVDVLFIDRDNLISHDLPVLKSASFPQTGDTVLCVFLGNGIQDGFCLGGIYSSDNPPWGGD
ncbi:hypothetical protein RJD24_18570 [Bacillaceae bacterium IKA-2]|nr:hypothetical protein RJD24_18570 [Bacillaceae bacterium IKA-2]